MDSSSRYAFVQRIKARLALLISGFGLFVPFGVGTKDNDVHQYINDVPTSYVEQYEGKTSIELLGEKIKELGKETKEKEKEITKKEIITIGGNKAILSFTDTSEEKIIIDGYTKFQVLYLGDKKSIELRSSPDLINEGEGRNIIAEISEGAILLGDSITVTSNTNKESWRRVAYIQESSETGETKIVYGYILDKYLGIVVEPGKIVKQYESSGKNDLNIRAKATINSEVIGRIANGSIIIMDDVQPSTEEIHKDGKVEKYTWHPVHIKTEDGKLVIGYISDTYLKDYYIKGNVYSGQEAKAEQAKAEQAKAEQAKAEQAKPEIRTEDKEEKYRMGGKNAIIYLDDTTDENIVVNNFAKFSVSHLPGKILLKLRSSPDLINEGEGRNIIAELSEGTILWGEPTTIDSKTNNLKWRKVAYIEEAGEMEEPKIIYGYVADSYLEITKEEGTVLRKYETKNGNDLNIRSDATISSEIIGTIANGSIIVIKDEKPITEKKGNKTYNWVKVYFRGKDGKQIVGYIADTYLKECSGKEIIKEENANETQTSNSHVVQSENGGVVGLDVSSIKLAPFKKLLKDKKPGFVYIRIGGDYWGKTSYPPGNNDPFYREDRIEIAKACEDAGIPYGFYYYSTAGNIIEADKELEKITEFEKLLDERLPNRQYNVLTFMIDEEYNSGDRRDYFYTSEITEGLAHIMEKHPGEEGVYTDRRSAGTGKVEADDSKKNESKIINMNLLIKLLRESGELKEGEKLDVWFVKRTIGVSQSGKKKHEKAAQMMSQVDGVRMVAYQTSGSMVNGEGKDAGSYDLDWMPQEIYDEIVGKIGQKSSGTGKGTLYIHTGSTILSEVLLKKIRDIKGLEDVDIICICDDMIKKLKEIKVQMMQEEIEFALQRCVAESPEAFNGTYI